MENIIISNRKKLNETIKKIKQQGKDKFHVITDFDRTLTKGNIKGKKSTSIISHIRDGKYLTSEYPEKAYSLYDEYHPIEIDLNISLEEKKEKMNEWWKKHTTLLIESGMNKNIIEDIVKKRNANFRDGCFEFIEFLNENNIPLIIMSAGPGQIIEGFLKKENILHNNVHIIANYFIFNKNGVTVGRRDPIIHTFNKTETEIKELPIYRELLKRKNVLLLGDLIGDIGMIEGFPYNNLIKIGYLNEENEENLNEYKNNFDAVILDDGNMSFVNNLLNEMV